MAAAERERPETQHQPPDAGTGAAGPPDPQQADECHREQHHGDRHARHRADGVHVPPVGHGRARCTAPTCRTRPPHEEADHLGQEHHPGEHGGQPVDRAEGAGQRGQQQVPGLEPPGWPDVRRPTPGVEPDLRVRVRVGEIHGHTGVSARPGGAFSAGGGSSPVRVGAAPTGTGWHRGVTWDDPCGSVAGIRGHHVPNSASRGRVGAGATPHRGAAGRDHTRRRRQLSRWGCGCLRR